MFTIKSIDWGSGNGWCEDADRATLNSEFIGNDYPDESEAMSAIDDRLIELGYGDSRGNHNVDYTLIAD